MDHQVSIAVDEVGRYLGSCICGYGCVGGDQVDVQTNLDAHLNGGVV